LRIGGTADSLYYLLFDDDRTVVKWIEMSEKRSMVKVCAAPVSVADPLKTTLFTPFESVILTSATLTVGGTFDFINARLGIHDLESGRTSSRIFPSPFDFKRQALIGIPLNNHQPDHPLFNTTAQEHISRSLTISHGRAFVLFTSYTTMRSVYEAVAAGETALSVTFLQQGTDTRHSLLNRFRMEQPAALFATDSFWEGVDAMKEHKAVYFAAVGGAGALIAKSIKKAEVIAYEDLGAEAIRRIEVENFPAVVAQDCYGGNLYVEGKENFVKEHV
ncbi:fumarate hydratase C-terminal domain-containing protein, partial [candidate division KSB1 bacterium]